MVNQLLKTNNLLSSSYKTTIYFCPLSPILGQIVRLYSIYEHRHTHIQLKSKSFPQGIYYTAKQSKPYFKFSCFLFSPLKHI